MGILYTGYLLSIVKIKKKIEARDRKEGGKMEDRERGKRDSVRKRV